MRYLINERTLQYVLGPLANPEFDDEFDNYAEIDPFDEEAMLDVLRKTALPNFQGASPLMQERIRATLRAALNQDDDYLSSLCEDVDVIFDYGENPRPFFIWLWTSLFPGESFEISSNDSYELVEDPFKDYLKALGMSDDDVEQCLKDAEECNTDLIDELDEPIVQDLTYKSARPILEVCDEFSNEYCSEEDDDRAQLEDGGVRWQTPGVVQDVDNPSNSFSFAIFFNLCGSEKSAGQCRTFYVNATLCLCEVPFEFANLSALRRSLNQLNQNEPGVCFVLLEGDEHTMEPPYVVVKSATPTDADGKCSKEALKSSIMRLFEASQRYDEIKRLLMETN